MQSYAEVYQRYFDPERFAPGSPKTAQKELPRASAYEALVSLKQKYYHDAKKPLDVNDLPTSAPLFDNEELLNRAEQITSDWTHQHPENMPTTTKSSVLSGGAVAPSATATAATAPSKSIQEETRRQAHNLWKLWTKNHINQQQASLREPSANNKQAPRRASDSAAALSPNANRQLGHSTGDYSLHRSSVPSVVQQQNMALGGQSMSMYDTNDSKIPEQTTDSNVPYQSVPTNRPVPAPAPIDDQANTGQQAQPIASDRPIDQQHQTADNKDISNLDQSDDTMMMNQQQLEGNIQGTTTENNAQVAPADDEIQDISGDNNNNKVPSGTTATEVGAGVATTAAAGTTMAATGGIGNENNDNMEVSSSLKPVISGGERTSTTQVSFAESDEQPKKEESPIRNIGGTKDHIAEQPELYHSGGLTGTQPVGKIDLKNL